MSFSALNESTTRSISCETNVHQDDPSWSRVVSLLWHITIEHLLTWSSYIEAIPLPRAERLFRHMVPLAGKCKLMWSLNNSFNVSSYFPSARFPGGQQRRVRYLELLRHNVQHFRYWKRLRTYRCPHYLHTIDSLLRSDRREFRFLFRVSQAEFERLVLRFRNYKMFLT